MPLIRPYQSKIPDALDAIIAAATAAFYNATPRVFIRDGPWTAAESGGGYKQDIVIGWYGFYPGYQYPTRSLSEELGSAAINSTNQEQGWAPSQEETFTVDCASLVLSGADPKPGEWTQLRHAAYGNIAAMSRYLADPAGGAYLAGTVEKLVIGRATSCHQVAQRRGVLCIVTFTLEATTVSQQLGTWNAPSAVPAAARRDPVDRGPGPRPVPPADLAVHADFLAPLPAPGPVGRAAPRLPGFRAGSLYVSGDGPGQAGAFFWLPTRCRARRTPARS